MLTATISVSITVLLGSYSVKVIVPVGLKPPASVAESFRVNTPNWSSCSEVVVVMVGLAGLTNTGSLPAGLVTELLLLSPL